MNVQMQMQNSIVMMLIAIEMHTAKSYFNFPSMKYIQPHDSTSAFAYSQSLIHVRLMNDHDAMLFTDVILMNMNVIEFRSMKFLLLMIPSTLSLFLCCNFEFNTHIIISETNWIMMCEC